MRKTPCGRRYENGSDIMLIRIEFPALPQGRDLNTMKAELDGVLEDDGWLLGSGLTGPGGRVELELEDEKMNPKYGILAVKNYLQKAGFSKETTMEIAGAVVGIFE